MAPGSRREGRPTANGLPGPCRLAGVHPTLGRHLQASVTTGIYCRYQPAEPVHWRLDVDGASGQRPPSLRRRRPLRFRRLLLGFASTIRARSARRRTAAHPQPTSRSIRVSGPKAQRPSRRYGRAVRVADGPVDTVRASAECRRRTAGPAPAPAAAALADRPRHRRRPRARRRRPAAGLRPARHPQRRRRSTAPSARWWTRASPTPRTRRPWPRPSSRPSSRRSSTSPPRGPAPARRTRRAAPAWWSSADGQILTARHVVDRRPGHPGHLRRRHARATAQIASEEAEQRHRRPRRPTPPPSVIVPAVLGGGVQVGDDVFAVGHPLGLVDSLTAGVVSGLEPHDPRRRGHGAERAHPVRRRRQPRELRRPAAQPRRPGGRHRDRAGQPVAAGLLRRHRLRRPDRHGRRRRRRPPTVTDASGAHHEPAPAPSGADGARRLPGEEAPRRPGRAARAADRRPAGPRPRAGRGRARPGQDDGHQDAGPDDRRRSSSASSSRPTWCRPT